MKSVLIIADYFGRWPKWFDMFLKSCETNPTIRWLIHTDCERPARVPPNVMLTHTSRADYMQRVSDVLGISFRPMDMNNLCDLRPTYGRLYAGEIAGYDYFGWGDIDVIYGDIRSIYTDEVFTHNVICSNNRTCTGHLTLIKNELWLREAFTELPHWRERLADPRPHVWSESLDEAKLSALFSPLQEVREEFGASRASSPALARYWQNNYFREQWTTPFIPYPWHDGSRLHPEVWYWHQGKLRNQRDCEREFLYLHLMNFKTKRYVDEELYGSSATWADLPAVIHFDCNEIGDGVVRIDRRGFHLLDSRDRQHP